MCEVARIVKSKSGGRAGEKTGVGAILISVSDILRDASGQLVTDADSKEAILKDSTGISEALRKRWQDDISRLRSVGQGFESLRLRLNQSDQGFLLGVKHIVREAAQELRDRGVSVTLPF